MADSAAFGRVGEQIEAVAPCDAPVILTEESGTGNKITAREIHQRSSRAGSFIAVNCAAFPKGLIESELFGHERGAFTGAHDRHPGFFAQANHGTCSWTR